jgi:hypothetical protein
VPIARNAVHAPGKRINAFVDLSLGDSGTDNVLRLDFSKQRMPLLGPPTKSWLASARSAPW